MVYMVLYHENPEISENPELNTLMLDSKIDRNLLTFYISIQPRLAMLEWEGILYWTYLLQILTTGNGQPRQRIKGVIHIPNSCPPL